MPRTSICCVSSRYAAASSMGTRSAHGASCPLRVACAHLFAAAAPDPLIGSSLFVCCLVYFFCLVVCLRLVLAKHTFDGAAYAARASSCGNGVFAVCCAGVRCACAGALPPTPPSRCRTSTLHQCVCVEYPRRGECCALIGSTPCTSRRTDRPCCMRTPDRARVQGLAEAVIDTEALVCSGSRCSSP